MSDCHVVTPMTKRLLQSIYTITEEFQVGDATGVYMEDKIRLDKTILLCGNFAVGLYMYIHTKINNSIQYHTNVQC